MKNNPTLRNEMRGLLANLREKIMNKQINKATTKNSKILNTNWSFIPNCGRFSIRIYKNDNIPPLELVGLEKHISPDIEITALSSKTKAVNKYLKHMIKQLDKMRHRPKEFWYTAFKLMERSNAFRTTAIQHVFPNWHRNMPLWRVIKINKMCSQIIRGRKTNIKYHRCYIPKGDTYRPLGVPTDEWRLYTYMLNSMLGIVLYPHIEPSQHGFQPNKGTLTAWQDIFRSGFLENDYIYEVDLKQFFPTVSIRAIIARLYQLKIPPFLVRMIEDMNRQLPLLPAPEKQKLDESAIIKKQERLQHLYKRYPKSTLSYLTEMTLLHYEPDFARTLPEGSHEMYQIIDNIIEKKYHVVLPEIGDGTFDMATGGASNLYREFVKVKRDMESLQNNPDLFFSESLKTDYAKAQAERKRLKSEIEKYRTDLKDPYNNTDEMWEELLHWGGIPQGLATSPLLSLLPLKDFNLQTNNPDREGLQNKAYADDGIFGRMKEINIIGNPDEGIVVHRDGYVKYAGKWKKKLKFLGLEYDGETNLLRAHTRSGSRLELPATMKDDLITANLMLNEDKEASELGIDWRKLPIPKPTSFQLQFLQAEYTAYHEGLKTFEALKASEPDHRFPSMMEPADQTQISGADLFQWEKESSIAERVRSSYKKQMEEYRYRKTAYPANKLKKLVDLREKYDRLAYIENEVGNPYKSWSKLFGSSLMGLIQSRLYRGDWKLEGLEQDFNYTYCHHSWAEKEHLKTLDQSYNVFNSSSYACLSLFQMLESLREQAYKIRKSKFIFRKKEFRSFRVYIRKVSSSIGRKLLSQNK